MIWYNIIQKVQYDMRQYLSSLPFVSSLWLVIPQTGALPTTRPACRQPLRHKLTSSNRTPNELYHERLCLHKFMSTHQAMHRFQNKNTEKCPETLLCLLCGLCPICLNCSVTSLKLYMSCQNQAVYDRSLGLDSSRIWHVLKLCTLTMAPH